MAVHPTVVVAQPTMASSWPQTLKPNQWSSDVCDCCEDMGICCFGFWCPWCLSCKISSDFGECLCLPLLDGCCGGIVPPVTLTLRTAIRERYSIQGTVCNDCCVTTCCTWCVWCQMARELKRHRNPVVLTAAPLTAAPLVATAPYSPHPAQPLPPGLYPKLS
ncbi:cornifelin homolog [Anguilla rostrata]|uniref:cornifelin homolog n=1 Tax=Anguilla rostrata TaxID=7938 RepID=UPI0030D4828F